MLSRDTFSEVVTFEMRLKSGEIMSHAKVLIMGVLIKGNCILVRGNDKKEVFEDKMSSGTVKKLQEGTCSWSVAHTQGRECRNVNLVLSLITS